VTLPVRSGRARTVTVAAGERGDRPAGPVITAIPRLTAGFLES
jgi:hypothetical protein